MPGVAGGAFDHPRVDAILWTFQGMMGSLNWPQEEWKANIKAVDSMSSMDVKLKNKHTSKKRSRISNAITCDRYRFILPMFDGRKVLQ